MTRASPPPILTELQNPESRESQIAALRKLKNEIIGHDQRKEAWITWGIVPILSNILVARAGSGKRGVPAALNGESKLGQATRTQSIEDEACLQAIILVGSFAQGGAPYVSPILAGNILPSLLTILSSSDYNDPRSLATLKTLNTIADRSPQKHQLELPKDKQLASLLYSDEHISCLSRIIEQDSPSRISQESINLASNLISKTCTEETHKTAVAESGVLDALSLRLASFVVSQGFVLPGAESRMRENGALGAIPPPAPDGARLSPILRAISVVIGDSKSRGEHFLSSPAIVTVFPRAMSEFSPTDIKKAPWGATYFTGYAVPRQNASNPIDAMLPSVPALQTKNSTSFPPLGSQAPPPKQGEFFSAPPAVFETNTNGSEEEENLIVSWLLYNALSESGMTRLMAIRLVTTLYRLRLTSKRRLSMFGYVLIPLVVSMFEKDYEPLDYMERQDNGPIPTKLRIKEEAPAVLASLAMDAQDLQKHAVDGGAIKKLSQLLKESYNPIQDNGKPMWSSEGQRYDPSTEPNEDVPPELRLGPAELPPMMSHTMRFREGILRSLAALAPFKDEYRKLICDNGAVSYIIDSLKPSEPDTPESSSSASQASIKGNPTPTLLAACGAVRSLTRSVSILRTSLIDAGVATPLFSLVKHRDIEIQIAATAAICNLALDFSPMKNDIIVAGVLPTLCEHAHSPNRELRLESIWALKHMAYNATNDIKMKIIQALEPGWLKQVISQDTGDSSVSKKSDEDMKNGPSIAMGTSNSAGQKVDILNPHKDDRQEENSGSEEDSKMTDTVLNPQKTSLDTVLGDNRKRKLTLNGDLDHTKQTRKEDIGIQEQVLDLVRNVICGAGASEMIDYIFAELGQNDLLDILADKIRPKKINVSNRKDTSASKTIPVPDRILVSVTFVLIHLGAGLPRQRQLLVRHPDLLKSIVPHFNHSDRNVRVNCVWVAINLTYQDDQGDRTACRERAMKLKSLGFLERLESLKTDPDLDVRERTKIALNQITTLLTQ
ncbi:hypothetical protein FQN54_005906 [Arachnomyces sp. PD_36]|nr:hypothetical protein FQN54_005906 [Arachnomyces sp. PD_36]